MKLNRLIILSLYLLAIAVFPALAQNKNTEKKTRKAYMGGAVYDSFTKANVKAKIELMTADSVFVDSVRNKIRNLSNNYQFTVPLKREKYILKITADDYEDQYLDYELKPVRNKQGFGIPAVYMKRAIHRTVDLDGVEVVGTRVQMTYRGDTIVYDAAAFNLPEGSMLDGLVRQLPGAELKDNGDIYVNGKKIDYLTLNGENFFKGKNLVMLENLPYYTVKNVKVYDKMTEKSQMLGTDVEQRDFVMDVNLKREFSQGYLANAEAGAGTENRWAAKAFGLMYGDFSRLSAFANLNNVNETRKPGNDGDWSPKKLERELQTTRQVGLHFETRNKKRTLREELDVTAEWNDTHSEQKDVKETFATAGNIFKRSHALRSADEFDFKAENKFTIAPFYTFLQFEYTQGSRTWMNRDSTYQQSLVNRHFDDGFSRYKRLHLWGNASYYKTFETGDILAVNYNFSINNNKPTDTYKLERTYYAAKDNTDLRNRFTDSYSKSINHTLQTEYLFQLPNFWRIGPRAHYKYSDDDNRASIYQLEQLQMDGNDQLGWLPSSRDSLLLTLDAQNSFCQKTRQHRVVGGIMAQRATENGFIVVQLPLQWYKENIDFQRAAIDTTFTRDYTFFVPNVFFYQKGKKSWTAEYYSTPQKPTVAQIMPITDTTNPLAITINNPNLKTRTRHRLAGKIDIRCDSLNLNYYLRAAANVVDNAFGVRTSYNTHTGVYTYMNDNVDGNWDAELSAGILGTFDKKRRWSYRFDVKAGYAHSVDFDIAYDDAPTELSTVNTLNSSVTSKLTYKLGKLTVGLNAKLDTRHSRSKRENFDNINTYDYQYGMNVKYTIPVLKLDVATDITNFSRRGYGSSMMNTDDLVWNAQLARSFMKGALTAKLTAYDVLHQLSTVRYSINAQGRTETWYRSVPRYVMFSLAYKFSKKPDKR